MKKDHRPFALVLAGGGARGLAHAGVLRGLAAAGYQPSLIVGVSMGAIVGATYALNPNWYDALLGGAVPAFPQFIGNGNSEALLSRLRNLLVSEIALQEMVLGWGVGTSEVRSIKAMLRRLTLGKSLEETQPPVVVIATDLCSGRRMSLRSGDAGDAAYASAALAGVFPPLKRDGMYLADGGYSDLVPVDVARGLGQEVVIVVDPDYFAPKWTPTTGFQAMIRSVEVSQHAQAHLRWRDADLVLRPRPSQPIATLDFHHNRIAVAAGLRVVRAYALALREILLR